MAHFQESHADTEQVSKWLHFIYMCNLAKHVDCTWQVGRRRRRRRPEHNIDERMINIGHGPVDRSYAGSGDIVQADVEVESECMILRSKLIQNYMHCFRENQIIWWISVVRSKQTPRNIISASAFPEHWIARKISQRILKIICEIKTF